MPEWKLFTKEHPVRMQLFGEVSLSGEVYSEKCQFPLRINQESTRILLIFPGQFAIISVAATCGNMERERETMQMSELLEIMMLVCFGLSWPLNAYKSYKARTAKGKSLPFLLLILVGYVFGIAAKLVNPNGYHWYVLMVYIINFCFVSTDFALYFRNRLLDKQAGQ